IYNFQTSPFLNNNSNADYEYYNNRWTPDNQDAKYPRAYTSPPPNTTQTSDFWTKSTAYMRLKNATFGYTLPRTVLNKIKIDQIRVYVASQNLWTISNLKFMDPEMVSDTGYPNMKSFTLGANVTF
ncbi:MAG: SusC/RagA family TonB-linked outer membrane protein, partial [Bacteroidales bacterium]|nr:SusC/RagA family TonB-linked outer membrane protein [Bacteroidales bacterium]